MLIIAASIGWVVGLLLAADGVALGPQMAASAGMAVVVGLVGLRARRTGPAVWVVLGLAAAALAQVRYHGYWEAQRSADVAAFTGRSVVRLRGAVADEPTAFGQGVQFPLAVRAIELGGAWTATGGTVLVRGVDEAPYRVGDRLEADGVLATPDPQLPPYLSPLRQQGIGAVANRPTVTPLGEREASPLVALANLREDAAATLNRSLPEPESGLARGITLGERRTLGTDLAADFQLTNTSHVLAVDGFKVGLVADVFGRLLGLVRVPYLAAAGTILGIGAYTAFVGASPSAVRAAIMGGLFVLGRALGRPGDTVNGLALAALAMTALSPFLLWNLAFQLSFVTTCGMAALVPVVDGWIPEAWLPKGHRTPRGMLREALVTTLAAEVASAPLVVASFDQISLLSLPVHAVVMPLLPAAIGLSALTAGVGMLLPAVGDVVGIFAWVPLAAIVGVVRGAGELPYAALRVPPLGLGWVILAYAALGLAVLSRGNPLLGPGLPIGAFWRRATAVVPSRVLVPALGVPIVLIGAMGLRQPTPVDRISFLDVGVGDAALVELADGGHLYVQGSASAAVVARAVEPSLPFWDRQIDLAAVTAGDDRALADATDLAGRLAIRRVILPPSDFSAATQAPWQAAIRERQIQVIRGQSGVVVRLGDAALTAYSLDAVPKQGRASALEPSLALYLTVGPARVLWVSALPADQARLAASGVPLSAQVLKLVGVSARWGLDEGFFRAVNPSVVVLPAGVAERFAKPTAGTLDLLANRQVYRTDLDGTVVISFGSEGLAVQTSR